MKSFLSLVKNEFLKIICQTSYKVLLFILLGIFIITPVFFKIINFIIYSDIFEYTIEDNIERYEDFIEYSNDETEKQYYITNMKSLRDFANEGYDTKSWQYDTMYYTYLTYYLKETMYDLLRKEEVTVEEIKGSQFLNLFDETDNNYEKLYSDAKKEREEFLSFLKSMEIEDYYQSLLYEINSSLSMWEVYMADCEARMLFEENEQLLLSYEHALTVKESMILLIESYEYLINNKIEYNSWQQKAVSSTMEYIVSVLCQTEILSEEEYYKRQDEFINVYSNFKEYYRTQIQQRDDLVGTVCVLAYSIENDIPTQGSLNTSSKSMFRSAVFSNINIILIFLILLSSLIISNEYSSGAARLLFIRPHSRNKILLSKYTSTLLFGCSILAVSLCMSFIMTLILNGTGDIFVPDLYFRGNTVIEVNGFMSFLGALLLSQIRIIFIVSLSFMLAALTKKGVLGILLGIVTNAVLGIIQSLSFILKPSILKFTIFPYYFMEIFAKNPAEFYISNLNGANLSMPGYLTNYYIAKDYNIFGGLILYAVLIGVILTITFIVFRKQEIKN